jgi:hypothetical protein
MSGFSKLESLMDSLLSTSRLSTFLRAASLGQGSPNLILNTTNLTTGNWTAVQILSPTGTIASMTLDGVTNVTSLSTITLNQGVIIYGQITSITLGGSTTVRLYGGINTTI